MLWVLELLSELTRSLIRKWNFCFQTSALKFLRVWSLLWNKILFTNDLDETFGRFHVYMSLLIYDQHTGMTIDHLDGQLTNTVWRHIDNIRLNKNTSLNCLYKRVLKHNAFWFWIMLIAWRSISNKSMSTQQSAWNVVYSFHALTAN